MASLNLQRNSEVFLSTVDLLGGDPVTNMKPSNTWKIEVLAGFAVTASSATQDITSLESGTNPDRSQQRFNTAINPVDWNFQTYIRPTGASVNAAAGTTIANSNQSGNAKPVADWFMWQALVSNTKVATTAGEQSVWSIPGKLVSTNAAAGVGYASTRSNFSTAQENYLYFKLDNVVYQINQATVNQATVDAGIEEIATTTWTGMGTTMKELTGTVRDNAISVFGGVLANGTSILANASSANLSIAASYHPYNTMNVAGAITTNSFIKNRLSAIQFTHAASAGATANTYTFPVTALTFDYTNNMTYLTPEELSALNAPIGQFMGTRAVTGSATMYLRNDNNESSQFLRNIAADSRTNSAQTSTANLIIGGSTSPYVAFSLPAVQFEFPQLSVDDVISMSVNFVAQEPAATKGAGGEVTIYAQK